MALSISNLISGLVLATTLVTAKPIGPGNIPSNKPNCLGLLDPEYKVDSSEQIPGAPFTSALSVQGEGDLSDSTSYSVGVTITEGFNLNLNLGSIVTISGGTSISTDKTTGSVQGATKHCPDGPWTCSLLITPSVIQVKGTSTETSLDDCQHHPEDAKPFTVEFPHAVNGLEGAKVDVCVCTNYPGADAPGAPTVKCLGQCS